MSVIYKLKNLNYKGGLKKLVEILAIDIIKAINPNRKQEDCLNKLLQMFNGEI